MTKKNKTENQKEKNSSSSNKGFSGFFRNEKLRFIVGLIIMVGSCYIFLSLTSFLFSGGNDYNLLNYSYSDLYWSVNFNSLRNRPCTHSGQTQKGLWQSNRRPCLVVQYNRVYKRSPQLFKTACPGTYNRRYGAGF